MAIFENLSMTTKTQSLICLVEGKPDVYLIDEGLDIVGKVKLLADA
jgi:hypothetical protein